MSLDHQARCDNCEKILYLSSDSEDFDEDILDDGWYQVRMQVDGDVEAAELCSERCLAVWSTVRARSDIGLTSLSE